MPVTRLTDTMTRRTSKSTSPSASAPPACVALQVVTAHTVVTNVTAHHNAPIDLAPLLQDARYDMRVVSMLTGLSQGHIRVLLHRYRDRFDPAVIQTHIRPNGRESTRFPRRLLSAHDVATLRAMYPVRVKEKTPRN